MSNVFFIADTHFGHKGIITFDEIKPIRPFASIEEHDEELVKRWNSVVKPKDTVWHLGDVLFGKPAFETLGRLNGNKKLVMGNHDTYPTADYLKHFSKVYGAVQYHDFILTHIPVHRCQLLRFKANIHGHLHHEHLGFPKIYVNVSCEQINLTPISFDEIKGRVA